MEQGWDPEVKKYFRRIINTISFGLIWLMAAVTGAFYFKLAYRDGKPLVYVILFYAGLIISFFFLLRYYYKIWRDNES